MPIESQAVLVFAIATRAPAKYLCAAKAKATTAVCLSRCLQWQSIRGLGWRSVLTTERLSPESLAVLLSVQHEQKLTHNLHDFR